jgi:hypothetical protein
VFAVLLKCVIPFIGVPKVPTVSGAVPLKTPVNVVLQFTASFIEEAVCTLIFAAIVEVAPVQ